jgi:pimeloyl-ACP methyl ester carboxylesterase
MSTDRTVVTPGGQVGIRRWGRADPAVVLVHGAGGNRASLSRLGDTLATRDVPAVAVSLPGRDGTDGPAASSVAQAAAWLARVLPTLAPSGTVVLGHSMGGGIAIELALTDPSLLHGLVLVATGARLRVLPAILEGTRRTADEGGDFGAMEAGIVVADAPEAVREQVAEAARRTDPAAVPIDWASTNGFDRLRDLAGIRIPALVAVGDRDTLTPPKYARWLVDHIADAELLEVPGAGHWLPAERPDLLANVVGAFVRRVHDG